MPDEASPISHVTDTAVWVAHFRAEESARPDALFQDPYASRLAGEQGREIAARMKGISQYTAWTLSIRTYVIDALIRRYVEEGVDMVVNLGAGLDARPYRMELPPGLQWVEVDHPVMIEKKEAVLHAERPRCQLERISLDLSVAPARKELLARLNGAARKILVLTEGVIPYLSEEQVAELAADLRAGESFKFWIAEYLSKDSYKYLKDPKRMKQMRNAPFRFYPDDWFGFFRARGWEAKEVKYLGIESRLLGRKPPGPWWIPFVAPLIPRKVKERVIRFSAYVVFSRSTS